MIHLVIGLQGSGKTLFLVSRAIRGYQEGKKIYSNIDLSFPYIPIDYNDIVNCVYEDAIVIIDEVHQLLPSRRSTSKINISIVDGFLSMVRKKGLQVYGSCQTARKVDVRFREEADYWYLTEKFAQLDGNWIKISGSQEIPPDTPIKIKLMVCQSFSDSIKTIFFDGNPLYEFYSTNEVVMVRGIEQSKDKRKLIEQSKEKSKGKGRSK
jgi:hypothetical protein